MSCSSGSLLLGYCKSERFGRRIEVDVDFPLFAGANFIRSLIQRCSA